MSTTHPIAAPSSLPFTMGDHLKRARLAAGLEPEDMAETLVCSVSTVHRYEADGSRINALALRAWAARTGFPLEAFPEAPRRTRRVSEQAEQQSRWITQEAVRPLRANAKAA